MTGARLDPLGDDFPSPDVLRWLGPHAAGRRWRALQGAGGFSGARFWRGESVGMLATDRKPRDLCLRAWPPQHPDDARLDRIHRLLELAASLPFVPVPYRGQDGRSWCVADGTRFECTDWMPGEAWDPESSTPLDPLRLAAAFRAVGRLHRAWRPERIERAIAPAVRERFDLLRRWSEQDQGALIAVARSDRSLPLRQTGLALLDRLASRIDQARRRLAPWLLRPLPIRPCVRDLHAAHLLFVGTEVTGIVDFGALRDDTIATDLGRLAGSLVEDQADGWQIAATAYAETSGESEPGIWEAARDLEFVGLVLGLANWLRWLWLDRRTFDDLPSVERRIRRRIARLDRV
ncbi:MAG TPA: aminoglycoside phosphotransferase family protein [Pirellulaceae bacterium]|nr:aminoglycoside phosphotransferase family protein [Pirellulaceae bacterium]